MSKTLADKRYKFLVTYSKLFDFDLACDKARLTPEERTLFENDVELRYDIKEINADRHCKLMDILNDLLTSNIESVKLAAFKEALNTPYIDKSAGKIVEKDLKSSVRKFKLVGYDDEHAVS